MKGFVELFVLKVFKVIDLQFLDVVLVLQRFDVVRPVGKVGGKDAHFAVAVNEDVVGGECLEFVALAIEFAPQQVLEFRQSLARDR